MSIRPAELRIPPGTKQNVQASRPRTARGTNRHVANPWPRGRDARRWRAASGGRGANLLTRERVVVVPSREVRGTSGVEPPRKTTDRAAEVSGTKACAIRSSDGTSRPTSSDSPQGVAKTGGFLDEAGHSWTVRPRYRVGCRGCRRSDGVRKATSTSRCERMAAAAAAGDGFAGERPPAPDNAGDPAAGPGTYRFGPRADCYDRRAFPPLDQEIGTRPHRCSAAAQLESNRLGDPPPALRGGWRSPTRASPGS